MLDEDKDLNAPEDETTQEPADTDVLWDAEDSQGGTHYLQAQLVEAQMQGRRNLLWGLLIGALIVVLALLIYRAVGAITTALNQRNVTEVVEETEEETVSIVNERSISKLEAIETLIRESYSLNPDITEEELEEGLYAGLIDSLGDKYSEYYSAEQYKKLEEDNEGVYYGIGAYVSIDKDTEMPIIAGIISNSPAEDSDLRAGDIIYEVNGTSTSGLSLTEVTSLIKGEEGTEVVMTIVRNGEVIEMTLTRAKVESPSVSQKMLDDDIGYIRISEFSETTVDQFAEAYAVVRGSGAKGLIIDLRSNFGGLLSSVVEICRQILPKGLIVYTEDKNGNRTELTCDGAHEIDLPLVVLVDGNTASAAEIMTGAIKDYGIGTVIGTTTYGKGIVQRIFPLSDGSAVKMTISAYYTPSGINIHGTGIEPDITVEFDGEAYYDSNGEDDNQLDAGIEEIRRKIAEKEQ